MSNFVNKSVHASRCLFKEHAVLLFSFISMQPLIRQKKKRHLGTELATSHPSVIHFYIYFLKHIQAHLHSFT